MDWRAANTLQTETGLFLGDSDTDAKWTLARA